MSTTTIVETTTEVEDVVTETSPVNHLDEQQELRVMYDVNGTPCLVDAQGWEVNVVSTNPQDQGDLQHRHQQKSVSGQQKQSLGGRRAPAYVPAPAEADAEMRKFYAKAAHIKNYSSFLDNQSVVAPEVQRLIATQTWTLTWT